MIQVRVNDGGEPVVSITVVGVRGARIDLDAIIDTGFSEYITLPTSIIKSLGLDHLDTVRVRLADGTYTSCDLYRGSVDWLDTTMTVAIQSAETDPLIGVRLLKECNLSIDFTDNGSVVIDRLD